MKAASPEDRQKIINLYESGMTRPAIARETGWSEGTVHNIIKASGVVGAGRVTGVRTAPEVEAEVMALYKEGVPWREIMARTKKTERTVSAIIKRNGGELGRKGSVTAEARQRIPVLYAQGLPAPEIGRIVGCHSTSVYSLLEEMGIDRRGRGCDNATYFGRIDTPNKAYWLGFIAADGCVTGFSTGNTRLVIKLARKDRLHLDMLHSELGATHPVIDNEQFSAGKMRSYSTLAIYSPMLVDGLVSHGITPRKSATLKPWDGPARLMPHYWRGLVDGDGYITINDRGVFTGLVGSQSVVTGYAAWVNDSFGTRVNPRPTKGAAWTVQVGGAGNPGSPLIRLLAALYDDAPTALARKKALADLAVHGKPLQAAIF